MTPAQETTVNRISRSLLARVGELHAHEPVSPELIVAGAVDFLAACLAALHSPNPVLQASLLDIVTETLKDRITHYQTLTPTGKVH